MISLASRPLLEHHVRRRVRAIPNVAFPDGHDVLEPSVESGRVTGCRVVHRETGDERRLGCIVFTDAAGRAGPNAGTPRGEWLSTASGEDVSGAVDLFESVLSESAQCA
ncbi:hypothetical protein [Mycolicibacterium rhodesiae]|uniref:hypothetical protein n=1 Tax=Mycolicibacterium rhodesiae TaxID=36814 RepID=UPI0003049D65|nr:hypothetical protein [Mycolicibacterium rhodesiae]